MDTQTLKRLQDAGFVPATVAEFLGLSPAEEALVETKVRFTALLKQARAVRGWTQAQLAKELQTTQQTVARAERGGESVSLDFLLRALVTLGLSLADLGVELRALDATLHRAAASCPAASPCTETQPLAKNFGDIKPLEKEYLIPPEKVAAVELTTTPVLKLIRGGFQGPAVKTSGARHGLPSSDRADQALLVRAG